MSEPKTFHGFAAMNRERCESPKGFNHQLSSWSISDWFTATLGELGEAANVAKKLNRVRDGIRGNTEETAALTVKLRQELGDVFVYLDLLSQSLGFNIGDAAFEVFDSKSKQLGYAAQPLAPNPSAAPPQDDRREVARLRDQLHAIEDICIDAMNAQGAFNEFVEDALNAARAGLNPPEFTPAPAVPSDKALSEPDNENEAPCERCQERKSCLMIDTGFAGESELLCAKCISIERAQDYERQEALEAEKKGLLHRLAEIRALPRKNLAVYGDRPGDGQRRFKMKMCVLCEDLDRLSALAQPSTGEKK